MARGLLGLLVMVVAAFAWVACSEDTKSEGREGIFGSLVDEKVAEVTAAGGGDVTVNSGGSAQFPGGSLAEDRQVTNREYEPGTQVVDTAVSNVFRITVDTPVGVNDAWRIVVPYDAATLQEGSIQLVHSPEPERGAEGEDTQEVERSVVDVTPFADDRDNAQVSAEVRSWGAYWVVRRQFVEADAATNDVPREVQGDAAAPKPDADGVQPQQGDAGPQEG